MSQYADRGTAAHQVLEWCLQSIYHMGLPMSARDFVGRRVTIEDGPHGELSPSGAKRWMTCPGSVAAQRDNPEAAEGQRHVVFDDDDAIAVQKCLDYVDKRVTTLRVLHGPVTVRTEHRVSPARFLGGTSDCDGTSDIALVCDGFVEHIDYKHGAGVPILADDPQNKLYLLGTCAEYLPRYGNMAGLPFATARCTIVQPRCDKIEPRIRIYDIEHVRTWIPEFARTVRAAIDATRQENAPRVASVDGCRFCPARGSCEEHARFALASMGLVDPDTPLPADGIYDAAEAFAVQDTHSLTGAQMRQILDAREIVVGALQAIEAHALQLLRDGTAPLEVAAGYKVVRGRSTRRWGEKDEAALEKRLKSIRIEDPETHKRRALKKSELYVHALRSVAQMEKVYKGFGLNKTSWKAFNELVDFPEGKLTIAPRGDPRDEVVRETAEQAFSHVLAGDNA